MKLSHVDEAGRARMVDVGDKPVTVRTAVAVSTNTVLAGGSSSALSSAFAAASAPTWGTSRSASPITNTLREPIAGLSARRRSSRRTAAIPWLARPDGASYNGCSRRAAISAASASSTTSTCLSASPLFFVSSSGTNQCTSGCERFRTSLHGWHSPHPSRASAPAFPPARSHTRACASHNARRCFPTPRGPSNRSACGNRPEAMAPTSRFRVPSWPYRGGIGMAGI